MTELADDRAKDIMALLTKHLDTRELGTLLGLGEDKHSRISARLQSHKTDKGIRHDVYIERYDLHCDEWCKELQGKKPQYEGVCKQRGNYGDHREAAQAVLDAIDTLDNALVNYHTNWDGYNYD
jgi:hypothetical protein